MPDALPPSTVAAGLPALLPGLSAWIDQIADRFESQWDAAWPPSLDAFLPDADDPRRREALVELVKVDLECRWRSGERRDVEDYWSAFPALIDPDGQTQSALQQFAAGIRERYAPASDRVGANGIDPSDRDGASKPRFLGRFELLCVLGSGSFGAVYKARDAELSRTVAIKVPHGDWLGTTHTAERFLREARSAAALRHPNIVPVHEIAHSGDVTYLVSDFIDGPTLAKTLEERRLTFHESAELLLEAAEALEYAHQKGVIHRDVKPSNILLDQNGKPHITDFGLARDATEQHLTLDGQILGTPAYMSPEQARGDSAGIDARSDVYSLGVVLYELLAGQRPFAGAAHSVLYQVLHVEPRAPRSLNPRIPRDLETICLKAIAKEPGRRYGTAGDLAADLRRYLHDEPIHARRLGRIERVGRWGRRHPLAVATCAASAAILLAAGLAWWRQPGTLSIRATPVGATISVANRVFTAGEESLQIDLRNGVYEVRVEAPHHFPERGKVLVERGGLKPMHFLLRHHQGVLDLDCEPRGGEIVLGDTSYGSRVRGLASPTGRYRAFAWADGHFQSAVRSFTLGRDEPFRHRLWLDRGVVWQYESPSIQGQALVVPDINGDGAGDLLLNELNRLAVFSSRDGSLLAEVPLANGPIRVLHPLGRFTADSQGSLANGPIRVLHPLPEGGTLVAACVDEARTDASPGGLSVTAFVLGMPLVQAWQWRGPPRDDDMAQTASMEPLDDLTGDGVSDFAVAGRDGQVFVADGATGQGVFDLKLDDRPLEAHLSFWHASGATPPRLWFSYRPEGGPIELGCARLDERTIAWRKSLESVETVNSMDCDRDGVPEFIGCQGDAWEIFDGLDGAIRWRGSLPGLDTTPGAPRPVDLDRDGICELVALCDDPEPHLAAVRLDGKRLWQFGHRDELGRAPPLKFWEAPGGELLLFGADALEAVDRLSGVTTWRLPGVPLAVAVGDWDGDGADEIIASMRGQGLLCLDGRGRTRWTLRLEKDVYSVYLTPDFDGDGRAEILMNSGAALVGIARGPLFLWQSSARAPLQATPLVVDTDSDGRPEVIQLGHWANGRNLACLDGATGSIRWSVAHGFRPNRAPALADWDGDGKLDVISLGIATEYGGHQLLAFRGSDGHVMSSMPIGRFDAYSVPVVADLNGDGVLDLATPRYEPPDIAAYDGQDGTLLWRRPTRVPNLSSAGGADLDGDGLTDVVAPLGDGFVRALRGRDGHELWTSPIAGDSSSAVTLADVGGDGVLDAVLVDGDGALHVLDGKSGASLWTVRPEGASEPSGRPAVVHGDDAIWIVAPLGAAGVAAFDYSNRATAWQAEADRGVTASPMVVDLDGDGLREVIVGTRHGELAVLDLGTGRKLWGAVIPQRRAGVLSDNAIEADPAVLDVDRDGILDILIADRGSNLTAVSGDPTATARGRWEDQ